MSSRRRRWFSNIFHYSTIGIIFQEFFEIFLRIKMDFYIVVFFLKVPLLRKVVIIVKLFESGETKGNYR